MSGAPSVRDPSASGGPAAPPAPPPVPGASAGDDASSPSADLLAAVYRLFKVGRMYEPTHRTLVAEAELVANAIPQFCVAQSSDAADLVFVGETVFVNGQMPRFSREAYGRAMELGALLDRCGISNLTIAKTVTPSNLLTFVGAVAHLLRDATKKTDLSTTTFLGIRARRLRARVGGDAAELDQSPAARVVRTYACSIVVLRGFYGALGRERPKLPQAMRRVAQRIVTHAEQEPLLLVALAAGRSRDRDEASTATGTALVAVLMARQLTTDRAALTNLVLAALLHDLGHQEALHDGGDGLLDASMRTLSAEDQDRVAARTFVGIAGLERVEPATLSRAVVAFEAHWVRRAARLGALYRGKRPAAVQARILAVARSFCELMAPGPYATPMGPEDAIQFLAARATDEAERTYVQLLTGALGIFPVGTTVELSTHEIGIVTRVPVLAVDFSRPPVRVIYDASGHKVPEPFDVDLAAPVAPGEPVRMIARTFDADQQQTQAMRAYVLAIVNTQRSRERSGAPVPSSTQEGAPRPSVPPGTDSRSGKRSMPTLAAPASEERPPTGSGRNDRPRTEGSRSAPVESPPTGRGALDSRPRFPPSGPVSIAEGGPPSRPSLTDAAATPSPPISSSDFGRLETDPPASSSPSSPGSSGRKGAAWKARQATRQAVRDPRAESDSVPPPPLSSGALSAAPASPSPSRPSAPSAPPAPSPRALAQPTPASVRDVASAPVPAPDTPLSRRAAHTVATQPRIPATHAPETPLSNDHPTPVPPTREGRRGPPINTVAVAGTRKVAWSDYEGIVDDARPDEASPPSPPPSSRSAPANPGATRKVSWAESQELAELGQDREPGDES